MKIETSKFKTALDVVKPALASKEIIEQTTSFAFINGTVVAYNDEINELNSNINGLKKSIITFSDEILVQDFGLYEPRYSFINKSCLN